MTQNLSINLLRTFLWVSTLRSFRQTADRMNTTQPAISARIAKLEATLGVRLFDRSTGHINLTEAGEALKPHAENIVRISDNLIEYVKGDTSLNGVVRIGVTEFAVETWLESFLSNINNIFPGLKVTLYVDTSPNLEKLLLSKALDLIFVLGPAHDERIQSVKFATYEYCWIAPTNSRFSPQTLYSIEDLTAKTTFIINQAGSITHRELLSHLKSKSAPIPDIIHCASYHLSVKLLCLKGGVALIPRRLFPEREADGQFFQLLTDWTPAPMNFLGCFLNTPDRKIAERIVHYVKSLL
ncbi:LysR family transcriptional regulator [Sneathiella limimaris]|uniref:LysR family transcriptional regulator n=1 Tax=Sneathiella limimaris TaxID=1964213 RepID=UPI00146E7E09|nr:LysR family transcriptional regulator [Sneathiella limimaris]